MRAEDFYRFMVEREQIRLNKQADRPWPWTEDKILQEYKFTNVKRVHDRTTHELVSEFYSLNRTDSGEVQLLNAAIFRYFGTIEFARALGWQRDFDGNKIKALAKQRLHEKERVFTGAYVITNQGIKAPKQEVVVDYFISGIWNNAATIVQKVKDTGSWKEMIRAMTHVPGFGGTGFMAKEVALDTMLTSLWDKPPVDQNTWCPCGPGARRGLNLVCGREMNAATNEAKALSEMLILFGMREKFWPKDFVELELHDIQFQLCEFAKYEKVRLGLGRPRSRYQPPKVTR